MSDFRGRFLWYDLVTTDQEAARAFYTEVVGWGTQEWEGGGEPYTMLVAGESPMGGLMDLPEQAQKMGAPPHWIAYLGAPDVDATVALAQKLGGHLWHGPMDIPTVGRFAVLGDPQGAVFSAFSPEGDWESMAQEGWAPGRVAWHELNTSDHEAAFAFYSELFGWAKHEAMDMGPGGTYQMYGAPGQEISYGGMMTQSAEAGIPPHWLYYIGVSDLDGSLAQVTKRGGKVLNGPMEVPGGDFVAQCMDPQGAMFALHGRAK